MVVAALAAPPTVKVATAAIAPTPIRRWKLDKVFSFVLWFRYEFTLPSHYSYTVVSSFEFTGLRHSSVAVGA